MQLGERIRGEQLTYIIERELGGGPFSRVYLARADGLDEPVAIKTLRLGATSEIEQAFFREAEILQAMYEAETNLDGQHAIPRVFDVRRAGEPRFLAISRARGVALDTLLDQQSGYLEEGDALAIIEQLARVLNLLHTRLQRGRLDLRLSDVFWQVADRQMQLIGWESVSAPDQFDAKIDLALIGAIGYQVLTGQMIAAQGQTERALEQRAGSRWKDLSLGTRRLLLRSLHTNPQRRFVDMADLRKATAWLINQWEKGGVRLATEIGSCLADGSEIAILQAENLLDLAKRKGGVPEAALQSIEEQIMQRGGSIGDALGRGRGFYEAGDYSRALGDWQMLVETSGRLEHWRWVQMAHAGSADHLAFTQVREALNRAVRALEQGDYDLAYKIQRDGQIAELAPLGPLWAEAEAGQRIAKARRLDELARNQAQNGAYMEATDSAKRAAQHYELAEAALRSVPYQDILRDEKDWHDLPERIRRLQDRARVSQRSAERLTQVARALALDPPGSGELVAALRAAPDNAALMRLCADRGSELLRAGQPDAALVVLQAGIDNGRGEILLLLRRQAALASIVKALDHGSYDDITAAANQLLPEDAVLRYEPQLQSRLEGALRAAILGEETAVASGLQNVLLHLFPAWNANEFGQQLVAERARRPQEQEHRRQKPSQSGAVTRRLDEVVLNNLLQSETQADTVAPQLEPVVEQGALQQRQSPSSERVRLLLSEPPPEPPATRQRPWSLLLISAVVLLIIVALPVWFLRNNPSGSSTIPSAVALATQAIGTVADSAVVATVPTLSATVQPIPSATIQPIGPTDQASTTIQPSATVLVPTIAPAFVSIDRSEFEQSMLFDLPPKVSGQASPRAEVKIAVLDSAGHQEEYSVGAREDGSWIWPPPSDRPALVPGTYTLIASIVNLSTGEPAASAPVQFLVQPAPSVTIRVTRPAYTQPDLNVGRLFTVDSEMQLEVVEWALVGDQEWYRVRKMTQRLLGWIQVVRLEQPLSEADKQRLPRR